MNSGLKKFNKLIVLAAVVVLAVVCGFIFWLYQGPLTSSKTKILSSLNFPIAIVNGQLVPIGELTARYEASQQAPGGGASDNDLKLSTYYSTIIDQAKMQVVAQRYGLEVSQKEINAEYDSRAAQADLKGKQNFEQLLQSYGLSKIEYQAQIIKPELTSVKLQLWFNSQEQLNPGSYKQAGDILQSINSGQDMAAAARLYSQDEAGSAVGGDLGFVDIAEILPELREPVSNMKVGEIKVLPSRYGLHIIKVEDSSGNKTHLRQIFLKAGDFDSWYNSESKGLSVIRLINI